MALLDKMKEYSEKREFDKIFEMPNDPSMTKDDIGQLFVAMATYSNPVIGKIILGLPEMPEGFPEKAEKACLNIINKPNFDINGMIETNGQNNSPIQIAVTLGSPSLVDAVIKKGADVNLIIGGYPLILSLLPFASKRTLPTVYKMSFGLDPEDPDTVAENYKSIIKVLIKDGANTNVVDPKSKMTFIQLAQELGLNDVVDLARKKQGIA